MVIFRQEVLLQHKSERGRDEELRKEQRDAFTFCWPRGSSNEHQDLRQGAGLRGGAQCTQVLGTSHALLECHCRSAVAESRAWSTWNQLERGTQHSSPASSDHSLAGQRHTAFPTTLSRSQAGRRGAPRIAHQPHQVPGWQERGTQHSQPTSAGHSLAGQRHTAFPTHLRHQEETPQSWHRWKTAKSCTLHVQALASPRAPFLRKAQEAAPFPLQPQPLCNTPISSATLILQLLQALKLLKNTTKALCLERLENSGVQPAA